MSTNTTRLGLIKPDFVDVVDVSELNSNADDIDAAVGAAVVTSTTRPSAPWTGQIIHETDTDKTLVWDGVAWVETGSTINSLDDLGDVEITTPADGELLAYDDGDWVNQALTSAQLPTGSILQVVSAVKTDTFSTSSTSFVDVTDLSATITPTSASSKIMVLFNVVHGNQGDSMLQARVLRDSTVVNVGDAEGSRTRVAVTFYNRNGIEVSPAQTVFLDSPATTSAITYKYQMRRLGTDVAQHINRSPNDADNEQRPRTASNILLMEVAG